MSNYSWQCRRNPLVRATNNFWRGRNVVYRLMQDGNPLYIGATFDAYERMKSHRRLQPWWPDVDHIVLKVYPTRRAALDAEAAAIKAEKPPYNETHLVRRRAAAA